MANFFTRLIDKFIGEPRIDWDELEADLISADIGAKRVLPLIEELRERDEHGACVLFSETREHKRSYHRYAAFLDLID